MELKVQQQQTSDMRGTPRLHVSNTRLMRELMNIIIMCSRAPTAQSLSVTLSTPEPCSLFLCAGSSPCLVPSLAPQPPGCWIMHILWRSWQAEPRMQTISIQTRCCLWEECESDLHALAYNPPPHTPPPTLGLGYYGGKTYLSVVSRRVISAPVMLSTRFVPDAYVTKGRTHSRHRNISCQHVCWWCILV